ncbi:MAG TPA: hypothetical protein VGM26_06690 [Rhizomicrobium sp.]
MLLHGLLLLALLHFLVQSQSRLGTQAVLESFITFGQKPAPAQAPPLPAMFAPPSRGGVTSGAAPSLAPAVPAPDVRGLGQSLFGCAPETLANLSPEQRSHCTTGFAQPDDSAVVEPSSHVKDPSRRAAEMRTKNTPGRVPCSYLGEAPAPHGSTTTVMADPVCVMDGLTNGFGPINGLSK